MMLGSKGLLTPLIPDCSTLCAPAILISFDQFHFAYKKTSFDSYGKFMQFMIKYSQNGSYHAARQTTIKQRSTTLL